jgi:hypothetical protein
VPVGHGVIVDVGDPRPAGGSERPVSREVEPRHHFNDVTHARKLLDRPASLVVGRGVVDDQDVDCRTEAEDCGG